MPSLLAEIETLQKETRPLLEHISVFRTNQKTYTDAEANLETLEQLLSTFRADLEKSKVENVLSKVKGLNSVSNLSNAVFKKKITENNTWNIIGIVLVFVGFITLVAFLVSIFRSGDKRIVKEKFAEAKTQETDSKPEVK